MSYRCASRFVVYLRQLVVGAGWSSRVRGRRRAGVGGRRRAVADGRRRAVDDHGCGQRRFDLVACVFDVFGC